MNIEAGLRSVRRSSVIVTVFAALFVLAGLAQISLGAFAVKAEYDRIAQVEIMARQASPYGSYYRKSAVEAQYSESSSAFVSQGRFLPALEHLGWSSPAAVAALATLCAGLGFVVAALAWVWRAQANLARVGIRTKYAPGVTVIGFLVPVANLVLPFEAVRELYNRSRGEPDELAHATADDVTAWWTAVIVGLLVFSAMIAKFALDVATNLVIITPLWMEFAIASFAVLLLLGSALLFAGLARSITRAQDEYLPQVAPVALHEPAPRRPAVVLRQG
jgi:hypothetical protein